MIKIYYLSLFIITLLFSSCKTRSIEDSWKTDVNNRGEYVNKIIDNNMLIGLAKNELINELGKPDITYSNDNMVVYVCKKRTDIITKIFFNENFRFYANLVINFDNDIVKKVYLDFNNYIRHSFTKEEWKTKQYQRYEIVDDLLKKNNNLIGLTKEQVVDLLGEPENITRKSNKTDSYMEYSLSSYGLEINLLTIILEEGKVVKSEQGSW